MFRIAGRCLFLKQMRWPSTLRWPQGNVQFSRGVGSQAKDPVAFLQSIRSSLPPLAQRMMEDGVLERYTDGPSGSGRTMLQSYIAQCRNAEEKHETVVSFSYLLTRFRMAQSSCPECLFVNSRCICSLVTPTPSQHKLWLLQHVGEFGRSNNTGSLLCLVTGARRTIRGIRHQEREMLDHVYRHIDSTLILFPNSESITLDDYSRERVRSMGSDAEEPLTLVLLDGTSRQAKNFDRFMPADIPRVRIREMRVKSWLDPIRRQTEEHRVCTAQG